MFFKRIGILLGTGFFWFPTLVFAAPVSPSGVVATVGTSGNVMINWVDNSLEEQYFKIEREITSSASWSEIGRVGTNITSYLDSSGLVPGTYYNYRITACDSTSCSDTNNTAVFAFNVFIPIISGSTSGGSTSGTGSGSGTAVSTVPSAPTNFISAATPSQNTIYLSWQDNATDETHFLIERRISGGTFSFLDRPGSNNGTVAYYSDQGLTAATSYEYRVAACKEGTGCSDYAFSPSVTTANPVDTASPSLPTLLSVITSTSQVSLNWSSGQDNVGIAGYRVYRNGALYTTVTSNYYIDTGITINSSFSYYVVAFDAAGNVSAPTETRSVVIGASGTAAPASIAAPTGLTVTNITSNQVNLSWSYVSGASGYKLYRNGVYLAATSNYSFTDSSSLSPATTYNYYVKAVGTNGVESGSSNTVSATTLSSTSGTGITSGAVAQTAPLAPSNLHTYSSPSANLVTLVWSDNSTNESSFILEREWVGTGNWASIYQSGSNSGYSASYDDKDLTAGVTYNYRVKACNSAGCSIYTELLGITIPSATTALIVPPTNLRISYVPVRATLTWDQANGAVQYKIFRNGSFLATVTGLTYTDTAIAVNTTYNYYVYSVSSAGSMSTSYSSMVSVYTTTATTATTATTTSSIVAQPVVVDATPPTPPTNLTHTINSSYQVSLSWSSSYDEKGVKSYRVFRNNTWIYNATNLYFADANVTPGSKYTYYVTAVDASNNVSQNSNSITVTIPLSPSTQETIENGTVKGSVFSSDGEAISDAVILFSNAGGLHRTVTPGSDGGYSLILPPGTFTAEVILPSSRNDLIKPSSQLFVVRPSEIKNVTFSITKTKVEKMIYGKVIDESGSLITDATINAYNKETNQWLGSDTQNGSFRIAVGPGTWSVAVRPTASAKWLPAAAREVTFMNDWNTESKEVIFKVKQQRSMVSIVLADDDGNAVVEAGVSIELKNQDESKKVIQYQKTDAAGEVEFWVNSGSYIVRAFTLNDKYINPDEKSFDILVGEEKRIYFMFKSRTVTKVVVSGSAFLESETPVEGAFVWAWSEGGGYVNLRTDANGYFSFSSLPNDTWHVGAAKIIDNSSYKAAEIVTKLGKDPYSVSLKLVKIGILPQPVAVSAAASDPVVAVVKSGASVYIPPESVGDKFATSSITVSISPAAETPSRPDSRVVGNAYEINVTDAKGYEVNKFNTELEVTLPYTEAMLKEFGIKAESLVPGYYDESTGAWVRETNYYVNKEKKMIVVRVSHLTRFALVAPADVTPPSSPAKIAYAVRKVGSVKLSWVNPTSDFHHVRVYRSETKSGKVALLNDLVFGSSFQDTGLKKKTYYYTVKSVDAAGNESKSNKSVAVNAGRTNVPTKVPVGLQKNSKGASVQLLQEILVQEGYLPSDYVIAGKYDDSTVSAVKDFQESSDLPSTGKIGSKTALLLNKLIK